MRNVFATQAFKLDYSKSRGIEERCRRAKCDVNSTIVIVKGRKSKSGNTIET